MLLKCQFFVTSLEQNANFSWLKKELPDLEELPFSLTFSDLWQPCDLSS